MWGNEAQSRVGIIAGTFTSNFQLLEKVQCTKMHYFAPGSLKYRQLTQVDIAVLMSPIVGDPGSPPYLFEMDSDPFHLGTMPGKKTAFWGLCYNLASWASALERSEGVA